MEQLPTAPVLIVVGLLAAAALARRLDHPIRPLEALAGLAAAALIVTAAVTFPGELLEALTVLGVVAALFAVILGVCAALESVPGLVRARLGGRSAAARGTASRVPALARRS